MFTVDSSNLSAQMLFPTQLNLPWFRDSLLRVKEASILFWVAFPEAAFPGLVASSLTGSNPGSLNGSHGPWDSDGATTSFSYYLVVVSGGMTSPLTPGVLPSVLVI